jgi:excisionase family DNA binding protein
MEYSGVLWNMMPLSAVTAAWDVHMNADQVLTIKDIAAILKLAEKTVYSMAQDGELPAFKVRGQWRIRRVDFDKWMAIQAKAVTPAKGGK